MKDSWLLRNIERLSVISLRTSDRSDCNKHDSPRCCVLWNSGTYSAVRLGTIVPDLPGVALSGAVSLHQHGLFHHSYVAVVVVLSTRIAEQRSVGSAIFRAGVLERVPTLYPREEITGERIADFAAYRQSKKLRVSTINGNLRVLRRALKLAVEWGVLSTAPKVKLLPGERHREQVVSHDDEAKYLAVAAEPLASVAAILCDTGLRPEECFRLRWESVAWASGTLLVNHGKSPAARRVIPMTLRVRNVLDMRWTQIGKPSEGWVWAANTRSGHIESSSLRRQHKRTFEALELKAKENKEKPIRRFVLYSLRHMFLTRLGEAGCDAWTLARIAGHSDIRISARYVHPPTDAVFLAMSRLGGHKTGHNKFRQVSDSTPSGS